MLYKYIIDVTAPCEVRSLLARDTPRQVLETSNQLDQYRPTILAL